MRGTSRSTAVVVALLATLAAACGGTGSDGKQVGADGLPRFMKGFEVACTAGTGFAAAAAFEPGPDALPLAFFTDLDNEGTWFLLDPQLGEEYAATELSDADSASERDRLKAISAIACLDVESSEPSGATCDFEDDAGTVTSLAVLNVTYTLSVHEARTGDEVGTASIDVAGADVTCPIVMSIDEGQTTMLPDPSTEDVIAELDSILGL